MNLIFYWEKEGFLLNSKNGVLDMICKNVDVKVCVCGSIWVFFVFGISYIGVGGIGI